MKKIFTFISLVIVNSTIAQLNLVPNPSFENLLNCTNPLNTVANWYGTNGSSIFTSINSCFNNSANSSAKRCCSVPFNTNGLGYQYPRTGNSMIGIFTAEFTGIRNYAQVKLVDSLLLKRSYYIEFFVNTEDAYKAASNNIGLAFSDTNISHQGYMRNLDVFGINPDILAFGNPIIFDTLGWVKIAGVYKAHGGEQYIVLGNFYDNFNTDTLIFQNNKSRGGGILIDDVSVIPLDSIQLQADAGRDSTILQGDSAFIGTLINGLDTVRWLQNGTTVIDTIRPGFWVHPTVNTCYVLTQTVNGFTSSDTVCIMVKPLPVTFIKVTVAPPPHEGGIKDGSVTVSWVTSNEINVSYYQIEYSTNGKDFIPISEKVKAKGGSSNKYEASIIPPSGGGGARVVAVDKDGKKTYSEVKSLVFDGKSLVGFYPNPVTDKIMLYGNNIEQITIITVDGKTIQQLNSSTTKQINVSTLSAGIYLIGIKTKNNYVTQKFIKW